MIRSVGIVDPVLLRPAGDVYEVVTGHRTVAAARAAGMERVPAVVKALDDAQALMALALDGTATGQVTEDGAAELRERLRAAGIPDEDIEDVMAAVPVAVPVAEEEVPVEAPTEAQPVEAEPVPAEPVAAQSELEPEPVAAAAQPELEPEPVAAAAQPEPVAANEPEAAPVAATAEPVAEPERVPVGAGATTGEAPSRWVPLPSGAPRLARLSSAFADAPRMLELLASDGFTGTVELVGLDGRKDAVTFLEGQCVAVSVEESGRRVARPLRLPAPEHGPVVEITVRPHPPTVVVALALALRSPARLVGLDASFIDLTALIRVLTQRGRDAAVVVSAPRGAGVILLSGGEPIAAYARREGEETGEAAETTDVGAVAELLAAGEGEVDVHDGPLVEPLDLRSLIATAETGD